MNSHLKPPCPQCHPVCRSQSETQIPVTAAVLRPLETQAPIHTITHTDTFKLIQYIKNKANHRMHDL